MRHRAPEDRSARRRAQSPPISAWLIACLILGTVFVANSAPSYASTSVGTAAQRSQFIEDPVPVLAYYYIWFDPSSWSRAKTDYPILGRYSSDERQIMRQHVRWAKDAGIDGFIVSWKSTDILNPRLEKLMEVSRAENFKLVLIYQGLDFERDPQPAARVAADLDLFISRFAGDQVFDLFSKPAVIWSGTWKFSREDVAAVTQARRDRLLILASERNADDYWRLEDLVDGNAYYWAAVDPVSQEDYVQKLNLIGEAVHTNRGLWIAPAAPGFDARLVGGTTVIDRRDGETLRLAMDGATVSSPDAVGVISWNEFSENTHIEPSESYGGDYLEVLADILGGSLPAGALDSSEPAATGTSYGLPLLAAIMTLAVAGVALLAWRRRQQ